MRKFPTHELSAMKWTFLLFFPLLVFSQDNSFNGIKKLPKEKLEIVINDSIQKMVSLDLYNFLLYIEEEKLANLKDYNKQLIAKMDASKWPIDLHFLAIILIEQKTDKSIIENILDNKRDVWELNSNWSSRFWILINENKLSISASPIYSKEQISEILDNYIKENKLGTNPMLSLNGYDLAEYEKDKLKEFLYGLNILYIGFVSKEDCPKKYGYRGREGMLIVKTK
jgi:Fe-S cluster biosynthesis and repair protein YggX